MAGNRRANSFLLEYSIETKKEWIHFFSLSYRRFSYAYSLYPPRQPTGTGVFSTDSFFFPQSVHTAHQRYCTSRSPYSGVGLASRASSDQATSLVTEDEAGGGTGCRSRIWSPFRLSLRESDLIELRKTSRGSNRALGLREANSKADPPGRDLAWKVLAI